MTEAEFDSLYQDTLVSIEDAVDAADADLDFETVGDVLTIRCPDGSQVIISRQSATRQLWLAARSGGFHFAWDADSSQWKLTREDITLQALFSQVMKDQAGVDLLI